MDSELSQRIIANLPAMKNEADHSDSSDDLDVVPLDFRTAMI